MTAVFLRSHEMKSRKRKDKLYDQMIEWISEHTEDAETLYNTFNNLFGITKEGMCEHNIMSPENNEYADNLTADFQAAEQAGRSDALKVISLTDFIQKVSDMLNSNDKTAVLNWIKFAAFLTKCDKTSEDTFEKELSEMYRSLCYVKNNFDNDVLQASLRTTLLGNENFYGAMLYNIGCTEEQVRHMADSGAIEDSFAPKTEYEKGSIALVYVDDGEKALYQMRDTDSNDAEYLKEASKIIKNRSLNANEVFSDRLLGGKVLRRYTEPVFMDAVKHACSTSTAIDSITVYNAAEQSIRQYSAEALSDDFEKIIVFDKNPADNESAGFFIHAGGHCSAEDYDYWVNSDLPEQTRTEPNQSM